MSSEILFYAVIFAFIVLSYLRRRRRRLREERLDKMAEDADRAGFDRIVITCPYCNSQVSSNASFCPDCGADLRKIQRTKVVLSVLSSARAHW